MSGKSTSAAESGQGTLIALEQLNRSAGLESCSLYEFMRIHRNSVLSLEIEANLLASLKGDWMSFFRRQDKMSDLEEWLPNVSPDQIQGVYSCKDVFEPSSETEYEGSSSSWRCGVIDELGNFVPEEESCAEHSSSSSKPVDPDLLQARAFARIFVQAIIPPSFI